MLDVINQITKLTLADQKTVLLSKNIWRSCRKPSKIFETLQIATQDVFDSICHFKSKSCVVVEISKIRKVADIPIRHGK